MIEEEKWRQAWGFLALDRLSPFLDDLWVFFDERDRIRAGIQERLGPWLGRRQYDTERGTVHYALFDWFVKTYGEKSADYLVSWVGNVFNHGAPDRSEIFPWVTIPSRTVKWVRRGDVEPRKWIVDLLRPVYEHRLKRDSRVEEMAAAQGLKPLSEWDRRWLEIETSDFNHLLETWIPITTSDNAFLEGWEKYCSGLSYDELHQIWEWGLEVEGTKYNGGRDRVEKERFLIFPGTWRFEMRPLLDEVRKRL